MRVLIAVHGYPPAASAGTEVYVRDFARALAALPDVQVCVFTRDADSARPEYDVMEQDDGAVHVVRVNNTFQACASFEDSYANPAMARMAGDVIDRVAPDIVHVQHLTCLSTGIPAQARSRGIPVIMTLNDYWPICHRGQLFDMDHQRCDGPFDDGCGRCIPAGVMATPTEFRMGRVARALPLPGAAHAVQVITKLREAMTPADAKRRASGERLAHMRQAFESIDVFLAPSETLAGWFRRFGIPEERLQRCDQGIDVAPFASALAARRLDRTNAVDRHVLRLGFAGGLIPSKGPHVLLNAVAKLPHGRVVVDLLGGSAAYHGDATYADEIAALISAPFIRRLGPVPHERMPSALADLDALVVPSLWIENAPFIIREAFAARVPVIASDLGGMQEMVRDDVDGLLFAPGDVNALTRQLQRLLEERGLIDRLRAGIRIPMTIEEDARQNLARYQRVLEPRVHAFAKAIATKPNTEPRISAVVLNYNTPDQTWLAVRSLQASFRTPDQIIVVDNGSADGSAAKLRTSLAGAEIIETGANLGFSGGCNVGIRRAIAGEADFVLLVNSDVVLAPDAMTKLLNAAASHPDAGILAPVLLSREEPDRIASAGIRFSPQSGRMRHVAAGQPLSLLPAGDAHEVDAVSGCVMLIRREVFDRIGLLDEDYFFSFEDIDFCVTARSHGFEVRRVPAARAYHEGARSIGRRSAQRVYFSTRNHLRLARKVGVGLPGVRGAAIAGLNAAYVMLAADAPKLAGLSAVARGAWHHVRRRYGAP